MKAKVKRMSLCQDDLVFFFNFAEKPQHYYQVSPAASTTRSGHHLQTTLKLISITPLPTRVKLCSYYVVIMMIIMHGKLFSF